MKIDSDQNSSVDELRRRVEATEQNPSRRARLFQKFGGPRAAIIERLTEAILTFIAEERSALNGATVLDYGCGVMPYVAAFRIVGARVIGADIGDNSDAAVRITDDGRLPISENSIDYVVSFQVLEHVPVPNDYLKEAHRVTKSGGKLFLTTHGQWPYHPTPTDYHRWTKAGLILELERAGFAVRSVTPVLNEFSAAVQNFVMNGEYRGYWRNYCRPVHWLAHCLIRFLESRYRYEPDIPAILCIKGEKR